MKKFIAITIFAAAASMNVFATNVNEFFGKWRNGNVQIEIQKDTILLNKINTLKFGFLTILYYIGDVNKKQEV